MKVLFVSRAFHGVAGGVERMCISLMNSLVRRGHCVELLSWDTNEAETYYPLDPLIVWHKLAIGHHSQKASMWLRARRLQRIRKIAQRSRPDVIVGFQQGPTFAVGLATLGMRIPLLAAERNAPDRFDHIAAGARRDLFFWTLRLADRVTIQMEDYRDGYPKYLHDRIFCIPNPVEPAVCQATPEGKAGEEKVLLCVARLSYQKNQSTLLDAFSKIHSTFPEWSLVLVGDGEDEERLRTRASTLGIGTRVRFTGAVKNVADYYRTSHLFCLPSRWEGFPNALAEAMAHGLPAVGFEGTAGVRQLIQPNVTGLLASGNGDAQELATTLARLMRDSPQRSRMGAAARQAVVPYQPDQVYDLWAARIAELVA